MKRKSLFAVFLVVIALIIGAICILVYRSAKEQTANNEDVVVSDSMRGNTVGNPVSGISYTKEESINSVIVDDSEDIIGSLNISNNQRKIFLRKLGEMEYENSPFAEYSLAVISYPVSSDDGKIQSVYLESDYKGGYKADFNMEKDTVNVSYLDDDELTKAVISLNQSVD